MLAALSGICNGLFTTPMKVISVWKWENIWFVFIVVSCVLMPVCVAAGSVGDWIGLLHAAPIGAKAAALIFGFLWGFGAICFGLSVDRLGVSMANSLVIGLSSALGSVVPLLLSSTLRLGSREIALLASIAAFLIGVVLCGAAGRMRDTGAGGGRGRAVPGGYLFAVGAGVMSAIFNVGYTLALPIADAGVRLGHSRFAATNCIWVLMLGAGAIPNLAYCFFLMRKNATAPLFREARGRSFTLAAAMGLLWGGSIFLYGAATPLLGDIGPSVGWPLSLAVGLLVANLMGIGLGEWRGAVNGAVQRMTAGIACLVAAIGLCAVSTRL